MRAADWVTGKAPVVIKQACELVPEIGGRSSVIENGLEVPPLMPEPLAVDPPRLLCLGRLFPQKGFDVAISAMALLSDRFPQLRLVIAGDGPERSKLERQIAEFGLTEQVELVGWVAPDKIPALINTSMAVLMPSRWEGLPSVALQAGVMARPLVATEVGGLREVVVDQQTGIVVEPEDSEGVADAVAFLVAHPEAATRMGQNARYRVQTEFSWQRCVDAYDALYRKLTNGGSH
ncbi:MAG: glycosyltransferase family 4 protein [Lysobacterales bacterium]